VGDPVTAYALGADTWFSNFATCSRPMRETIRGFTRYAETVESLPGLERSKVDDVAKYIFASFRRGCVPILSVKLVGHADTDQQKGHTLQKTIDDSWNRRLPPTIPQPPPPRLPDWFWKDLPKLDNDQNWKKWRDAVKKWCEDNHVDPDPIMDTLKDILRLPDASPGPIDADFEKELRRRQVLPPSPSDDD
jgi:hypothetical protein